MWRLNYTLPLIEIKTMATLAALKKQIAALEAQVERVTKEEMGAAISKVKKMMSDFGLNIEHLTEAPRRALSGTKKGAPAKTAKKAVAAKKSKGSKPPKYQDPATGVTWTGVGRAPVWIASAKNRDEFLIAKASTPTEPEKASALAKKATKRAAPFRRAKVAAAAKKATRKVSAAKQDSTQPVQAKKVVAKKAPAKKAAPKKAVTKKTVAKKSVAKKAGAKATAVKKGAAKASGKQAVAKVDSANSATEGPAAI